tara:strand:- start:106 stop:951 length:846 start_codon:yes stop_codon:yes gene_type:complete
MTIVTELLNKGSKKLKSKKINSYLLDSEVFLSKILNKTREEILVSESIKVSKNDVLNFNKMIDKRQFNEPVAYILKEKEFWNKKFFVNSSTLIPRPETELLIEKIINIFKNKSKIFILDIGTGTGCIILTLVDEIKQSRGIAIDISNKAIRVAKENAKKFQLEKKVKFQSRSLDQVYGHKFDLIVSNPPYICSHQIKNLSQDVKKYEPRIALDGGKDGLDVIKKVIYKSKNILKKKGILALEIGNGQYKSVSQILSLQGFKENFIIKDYRNNIRCILTSLN